MKKNHINLFKRECVKCLLDFKILNIKNNINVYLCNTCIKNYDENMIMITVVSKHYHYMMKSSGIIKNCEIVIV